MTARKESMPETWYRASRCCRVLGNPTAYLIMKSLSEGQKSPTQLAEEIGLSVSTASITLRHLREVDLVRYLTDGEKKLYWVKDPKALQVMGLMESFVEAMREKEA